MNQSQLNCLTDSGDMSGPALEAALDPRVFEPDEEAHRAAALPEAARGAIRTAITQYAQGDLDAESLLLDRLARDRSADVREMIALSLTGHAAEPAVRQALQSALRTDADRQVRWAASYAMRLADSA
jgi:hypothetical protein